MAEEIDRQYLKGLVFFDRQYLKGLVFRTSRPKEVKGESGTKVQHIPVERELTPADMLDWKDLPDRVVIVAADGQKHEVKKTPAQIRAAAKSQKEGEEKGSQQPEAPGGE